MGKIPCLIIGVIVCVSVCLAQTTNQGAITGTVTDPSGAVIPRASVSIINVSTGVSTNVETNSAGIYRMSFLPPGSYDVVVQAKGFKETRVTGTTVTVGQIVHVDLRMLIGSSTEQVTVSATPISIDTTTAARSAVITEHAIKNLPLNGREWIQLATIVPGALSGNVKRGTHTDHGVEVSFNGARDTYNNFLVDGASSTDAYHNTLISSPALDAIKEFRVETNMYSAQYGRAGGAVIMAVTNSGTNRFHGSLYEYLRNKALDALPPFANKPRNEMPNYLWNQFGGSIGGPIKRNKLFFFFTMEKLREKTPGSLMTSFAPTPAEANGDVSGTTNPWTGQPTVLTNPYTGQPIPGNVLPPSLVSPIGKKLMSIWSQYSPNYNDPFLNLRIFRSSSDSDNKYLPRIDYHINAKNSVFGELDWDNYNNGTVGNTVYGDQLVEQHDKTMTLNYTHIFSPTLMNNLVYSYTWYLDGSQFVHPNMGTTWGMYAPINQITPRILLYTQGYRIFTIGGDGPLYHRQHTNYAHDVFTWVKGKQIVSFGADFRQEHYWWSYDSGNTEDYFGLLDGLPGYQNYYGETGSTFTDLLTAMPVLMHVGTGGGGQMPFSRNAFAGYLQDEWKVLPRFTLDLGARYDYESPFKIDNGEMVTLDFKTGLPQYCASAPQNLLKVMTINYETGGPCTDHKPQYTDFSPRVGFAFEPFNNDQTVLRGGYGLFYNSENAFNTTYQGWVQPFAGLYSWYAGSAEWNPAIAPGNPLFDGQQHFTPLNQKPYGLSYKQGASLGYFIPTTPFYPDGYMEQYNLTLDRALGKTMVLNIGWVASRGVNLNGPTSVANYSEALQAKIQKANPGLATYGLREKGYSSFYNALQVSLRKQTSHGIWFLANYTWSHALTDSSNDATNEALFTDVTQAGNIVTRRMANADFDVPQHFSFSGIWSLPFGHGKFLGNSWSPAVNEILGGWQASGILTLQSGVPFTVYTTSLYFPDRVCNGALPASQRTATHWFNTSCFVTHKPKTIVNPVTGQPELVDLQGNAPPNAIFGPGLANTDLELEKNFKIRESVGLNFQGQFFNAFNHMNLQAPGGNYFFNTPSGAEITRAASLRDIQFGLTLSF